MTEYPPFRRRDLTIAGSPYLIMSSCWLVGFIILSAARSSILSLALLSERALLVALSRRTAPPSFSQRPIERYRSAGQGASRFPSVANRSLLFREKEGSSAKAIRFEERKLIIC